VHLTTEAIVTLPDHESVKDLSWLAGAGPPASRNRHLRL